MKWVDAEFCPRIHGEQDILEHSMSEFESLGYLLSRKVISKALGHSSVAFTMDVHSHIIEGMQQDVMMLLDGVLPEAKNGVSAKK